MADRRNLYLHTGDIAGLYELERERARRGEDVSKVLDVELGRCQANVCHDTNALSCPAYEARMPWPTRMRISAVWWGRWTECDDERGYGAAFKQRHCYTSSHVRVYRFNGTNDTIDAMREALSRTPAWVRHERERGSSTPGEWAQDDS